MPPGNPFYPRNLKRILKSVSLNVMLFFKEDIKEELANEVAKEEDEETVTVNEKAKKKGKKNNKQKNVPLPAQDDELIEETTFGMTLVSFFKTFSYAHFAVWNSLMPITKPHLSIWRE